MYGSLQSEPQLIPAGLLVTVPLPVPDLVTLSVYWGGASKLKVAVTALLVSVIKEQLPVPEQAPDQPAKVDPEAGEVLRVTAVP